MKTPHMKTAHIKTAHIKTAKCPICGKPAEEAYRPFCSKRCADVDLQRWLSGAYAVPAVEAEEDGSPEAPSEED